MSRFLLALSVICVFSHSAAAQSVYVAGALGADISLASGQESFGFSVPTGGGEALSGAARIGTVLNDRFGIELEVSRAAEIRNTSRSGPLPLAGLLPIFLPEIESRTRITTVSTTASIRQQVADNVALAYLGGVVFHRTDSEIRYRGFVRSGIVDLPPRPLPTGVDFLSEYQTFAAPFILPPGVESIRYGAGPVVGFEAHIGYGEHLTIVPGIRMHSLPASWLVRPNVGVGWTF